MPAMQASGRRFKLKFDGLNSNEKKVTVNNVDFVTGLIQSFTNLLLYKIQYSVGRRWVGLARAQSDASTPHYNMCEVTKIFVFAPARNTISMQPASGQNETQDISNKTVLM